MADHPGMGPVGPEHRFDGPRCERRPVFDLAGHAGVRTDQSFTVSTWAYLDDAVRDQTIISQAGAHQSGFWLKYYPATTRWVFTVAQSDTNPAPQPGISSTHLAEADVWTHLVAVYDASRMQLRIYVNGEPSGTLSIAQPPMASSGPVQVGRTLWNDKQTDYWHGGVDDTSASIKAR